MSVELTIRDPLGEREADGADFPLSVGGPGSTIVLPGLPAGAIAWIAFHDGQLFLQPADGAGEVLCNGVAIARSTWLRDGDVVDAGGGRLRLTLRGDDRLVDVEDGSSGNLTLPPAPGSTAVVTGGQGDEEEMIPVLAFSRIPETRVARRVSPARGLVALGLGLLGLVAWFLWAGYSVRVTTQPAAESVAIKGHWPVLRVGENFFLRPGTYTLVASRRGYETLNTPITIAAKPNQQFAIRLQKLAGRLKVETAMAARVEVDGRAAGAAPGEFRLAPGKHHVSVTAERYLPFQSDVIIAGENRQQVLNARLVPAWAVVRVLTDPSGATVSVAGQARGVTPIELELDAGSHHVELRHAGFKDWSSDIQVVANRPQTLGPVHLGLPDAHLALRSDPAGASVSVGGAFRGRTPIYVDVRPEVALTVLIARNGYEPGTTAVTLKPGERREVSLVLKPIIGEVTVQAVPADAEVLLDGRSLGPAGRTYRLPATTGVLEVRAPGYRSFKTSVTPRPGLPQIVNVQLDVARGEVAAGSAAAGAQIATAAPALAPSAAAGAMAASIRAKTGQELRLMPAASYTMGSPRREAGRRANESQRPVELRRRYYLATREVTNADYRQFRAEHHSGFVGQNTLELDRQPVVKVNWQEAAAFCNWLSAQDGLPAAYENKGGTFVAVVPATTGYRMPTEAEWEWSARASPGGALRKYPWGDTLPVPPGAGNYGDRSAQALLQPFLDNYDDGYPVTAPVGSFPANSSGLQDMGGNVAEWTSDLYTVQPPAAAVVVDPWMTAAGELHVIRGSSWRQASVTELRASYRDYGDARRDDLGFRIARYAE